MMSKKDNSAKNSGTTKKWSFLDTAKKVLDENKSINSPTKEAVEDKKEPISSSDNMIEVEPNINQLFSPK
ncbi:Uncharacterised protein [Legionella wadsworthii]|uniref:Uncharacterized protein n=1 Tax=Legionella wadsworthii TaxID=28088 RepID=A0A378LQY6_9GAMM|nr:hypothetical protein [Legionella wadsworthii]STY29184.1 Uncharacterised protein [Legionella wadsworthii]